jgi:hypothetical protein
MTVLTLPVTLNSGLTPRTPHSHSSRFEDIDLDGDSALQTEPLLRRSSDDLGEVKVHSNPVSRVLATSSAILLMLLVGVTIQYPELLHPFIIRIQSATIIQQKVLPADFKPISYENYTEFPLTPAQYRAECWKLNSGMMMNYGYWADAKTDVPTGRDPGVCSGTITYMLGGGVGLLADLGLMAQVAGMAREVSGLV